MRNAAQNLMCVASFRAGINCDFSGDENSNSCNAFSHARTGRVVLVEEVVVVVGGRWWWRLWR